MQVKLLEQEQGALSALARLASATDEWEGYARPHASRIASLAEEVARLFQLGNHDRVSLRLAALAHDLGEAVMEREYLKREGPLNEEERLDLARHPVIGEQEAARLGADRGAQLLVRWHHEWWNGTGYPDKLQREQIPLAARILRVVDSYASLTDTRPFRSAYSEEKARQHLVDWAGLEFDPAVVRIFLSLNSLDELRSFGDTRSAGAVSEEPQLEDPGF
jgi:HD-GYP domain-containing protein (c-di-GMP phosphodiesterase class II)